ncbi:hypothetical protein MHY30_07450 [Microbacterium sp. ACRRU]|uniref:magnesium chelatase subunit ChlI family protein n=1 Tax=Microbacterium sp. ACRRU TaxID=2918204 RepID=UPI001EF6A82C|nr:hypothetical protein [Microbacterium sp. ACRRU]MCG7417334.1 hypothetical protein [Microbacterium sp. ACRRU]
MPVQLPDSLQITHGSFLPLHGPLLDRIDLDLRLQRVSDARRSSAATAVTTRDARTTVRCARERAARRWAETPWRRNADVPGTWLRGAAAPDPEVLRPLDTALRRGTLTLRGYDRLLRVRKIDFSPISARGRSGNR